MDRSGKTIEFVDTSRESGVMEFVSGADGSTESVRTKPPKKVVISGDELMERVVAKSRQRFGDEVANGVQSVMVKNKQTSVKLWERECGFALMRLYGDTVAEEFVSDFITTRNELGEEVERKAMPGFLEHTDEYGMTFQQLNSFSHEFTQQNKYIEQFNSGVSVNQSASEAYAEFNGLSESVRQHTIDVDAFAFEEYKKDFKAATGFEVSDTHLDLQRQIEEDYYLEQFNKKRGF